MVNNGDFWCSTGTFWLEMTEKEDRSVYIDQWQNNCDPGFFKTVLIVFFLSLGFSYNPEPGKYVDGSYTWILSAAQNWTTFHVRQEIKILQTLLKQKSLNIF